VGLRIVSLLLIAALGVFLAGVPAATAGVQAHRHHHRRHHRRHSRVHRHRARRQTTHSATAAPPSSGACANANTPSTQASAATMGAAVDCLINHERTSRGLPALTVSSQLNRSAQNWNDSMIASGNFTHGSNFAGRISAVGYNWQTAGENIATGYLTPAQVVSAWMASTDHCQNILDPSFRNVGTGETPAPVGGWASGPATWTQDFGLLMSQSALSGNHGPQNGCPY
jgi:uncharacterized protein YkwD